MKVYIKNLRARPVIGVYEFEKHQAQDIIFNIELEIDAELSKTSDNLEDTVDYCELSKKIITITENSKFQLIERLMGEVLKLIKSTNGINSAKVEIVKAAALVPYSAVVSIEDGF